MLFVTYLRREERGVEAIAASSNQWHMICNQSLQEFGCIGALYFNQTSIWNECIVIAFMQGVLLGRSAGHAVGHGSLTWKSTKLVLVNSNLRHGKTTEVHLQETATQPILGRKRLLHALTLASMVDIVQVGLAVFGK